VERGARTTRRGQAWVCRRRAQVGMEACTCVEEMCMVLRRRARLGKGACMRLAFANFRM
jgi:hypothetical protein